MSKSPVHANRIQQVLYQEGERAIGEGIASTKPDHLVRVRGARRLGAQLLLATGVATGAFMLADKAIKSQPEVPKLEAEYEVQGGDNPWSVAEKFTPEGEDPRGLHDQLTKQDAFREDGVLTPGEVLQVPTTTTEVPVEEVPVEEVSQQVQPGVNQDTNPGDYGS